MGDQAVTTAYKVFTHDLCPPIRGGTPVWGGTLPYALPRVEVDTSEETCAAGWNACATPANALWIGGLWPNGRPSRLFRVETSETVHARGNKVRAATWTIVEELDVEPAIRSLSVRWFEAAHVERMVVEQMAWRDALARPQRDAEAVERGLREALAARGLDWKLRRFESARDARDARDAMAAMAAMAARVAWDARVAMDAMAAWDARAARDAWDAWAAWDARDAWDAWDARAAWAAWAARAALITQYASLVGAMNVAPDRYTVGIRDAYRNGLAVALPTGPGELGWAMEATGQ